MAAQRSSINSGGPSAAPALTTGGILAISTPLADDWDAFVLHHPQGHLLQLTAWARLKSAFGWSVQRIAVIAPVKTHMDTPPDGAIPPHPRQPIILAGAQVLFRQRYGVSMAYVPRGPLLTGDTTIDTLLLATLTRSARQRRAVFLRLEPNILEDDPQADARHTWLLLQGFQPAVPIQPHSSIHLDLTIPLERLFAGFSKGHRADIRRAERTGLQVRVGTAEDIPTFTSIMQATGARAHFSVHTEAYYRRAYTLFQARSHLLLAEQETQVVAGHMVFADSHGGLYLYSGATESGLKSGANHCLQWYAMRWAREQGCRYYDLWGIPDALGRAALTSDPSERAMLEAEAQHDPLIGVYRFKKGFGGRVVRYLPAYDQVYLAPLYALWQKWFRA